ncbi:DoxX family protein [Galbibacter sp.]|uniref:DoxX family protein n=1 Tax=Galbibacter sp. TaxID=2918471 RepID=UPI003A8E217B
MNNLTKFDKYYLEIKRNRWYWYFSIFCRLTLALGFVLAGMVKIMDERFASGLSEIHPMGTYLTALYHTGYYYTFIGIAQVLAAILLLIPRTVTLGALLYLPIIVNICILSFAVRFEGSAISAPLMLFANLYILVWNYDKLKYILPFKMVPDFGILKQPEKYSNRFPFLFFTSVVVVFGLVIIMFFVGREILPRNSLSQCKRQYAKTELEDAGNVFCECVHVNGKPLDECLAEFEKAKKAND